MKVLLVGGGGREHAMAKVLNNEGAEIYTVMKNINPGIAKISEDVLISNELDIEKVSGWAVSKNVELAIIGPEAPLEKGIADMLDKKGIKTASPSRNAARIETSKEYMRNLMRKYKINGAVDYEILKQIDDLKTYIIGYEKPFVIKPIGLTGGKGVHVMGDHFQTKEEGLKYAEKIINENIGGGKVIIEEKLVGEEFTLQIFTDGANLVPMPIVQDFKRALEGDEGPNTGGMGSYSMENHMLPFLSNEDYQKAIEILKEIINAMRKEGDMYKGVMYGQFMLTTEGPKVIEINARFGDPEAMNVLSLVEGGFLDMVVGMADGDILNKKVNFSDKSTVVKYIVPAGYGYSSKVDSELEIDEDAIKKENAILYYASVNERNGKIYTTSSRSLAIVGIGDDLEEAEKTAEKCTNYVKGDYHMRHDIGKRAKIEKKIHKMKELLG